MEYGIRNIGPTRDMTGAPHAKSKALKRSREKLSQPERFIEKHSHVTLKK